MSMRIIGGIHRSRQILAPQSRVTRPITDRVKQSLFDRLWSLGVVGTGAPARRVLDLFCGTGSLGLEALSRGAEHCTFVEKDRSAVELLGQNLQAMRLGEQATVLPIDVMHGVSGSWQDMLAAGGEPGDANAGLIFCDPPYAMTRQAKLRMRIEKLISELAAVTVSGGVLMLRTEGSCLPNTLPGWQGPQTHAYGSMSLHFYHRA